MNDTSTITHGYIIITYNVMSFFALFFHVFTGAVKQRLILFIFQIFSCKFLKDLISRCFFCGKLAKNSIQQCFCHIIAPLTMQIALPNLKNLEIDLLKGTATAYVIGVVDVMGRADKIIAQHRGYGQIWILLAAAIIYFLINVVIELVFNSLTRHYSRHERGIA